MYDILQETREKKNNGILKVRSIIEGLQDSKCCLVGKPLDQVGLNALDRAKQSGHQEVVDWVESWMDGLVSLRTPDEYRVVESQEQLSLPTPFPRRRTIRASFMGTQMLGVSFQVNCILVMKYPHPSSEGMLRGSLSLCKGLVI